MQAAASIGLLLMSVTTQSGLAQQQTAPPPAPAVQQTVANSATGQPGLPPAPEPKLTDPLYLRDTGRDYTKPKSHFKNPIAPYTPIYVPLPTAANSTRLGALVRDGSIYLSRSDA